VYTKYAQMSPHICINILQMPYLLFTPYHIIESRISPPPNMATSSGVFLATIYNQSQLVERKHAAHYWSINTAATAVPLSVHPSPLVITTKLAAAILGGRLFGGGVLPAQYCPCGCSCLLQPQQQQQQLH